MKLSLFATALLISHGACATPIQAESRDTEKMHHQRPHIVSVKSNVDFNQTVMQLQAALDARNLKTFAVIDHAAGAESAGLDLRPTTLFVFGNPRAGTPLMQAEQRIGLRLPLKMLVYVDENGEVQLGYPDLDHLFHEYGLTDMTPRRDAISAALTAIAAEAGSP